MVKYKVENDIYEGIQRKRKKYNKIMNIIMLHIGTLLLSIGVYFFKIPNGFSTGGVSGLGTVLAQILPISAGQLIMLLNIIFLILGFVLLGKETGALTVYCSLLFSALVYIFEIVFPMPAPMTNESFLELVYAMLLTAIGSAMIFYCNASSGGTDIVALIIKKYSKINPGKALLLSDSLIAASSFFVFGVKGGLYSLLGLFAKAFLVDNVIESLNSYKYCVVITSFPEKIEEFIIKKLHRGVTVCDAMGGYTEENKKMLHTVCKRIEVIRLKQFIHDNDANAFLIITSSNDIIGRGFRNM